MLIRQSRETFAKLFKWYAGSALVGIAALLAVGVVLLPCARQTMP